VGINAIQDSLGGPGFGCDIVRYVDNFNVDMGMGMDARNHGAPRGTCGARQAGREERREKRAREGNSWLVVDAYVDALIILIDASDERSQKLTSS
jgi:hypothetical protein